jgi:hypothetical protein
MDRAVLVDRNRHPLYYIYRDDKEFGKVDAMPFEGCKLVNGMTMILNE